MVYLRYTSKRKGQRGKDTRGPPMLVSFASSPVQRKANTYTSYFFPNLFTMGFAKQIKLKTGENEEPASRGLDIEEVRPT